MRLSISAQSQMDWSMCPKLRYVTRISVSFTLTICLKWKSLIAQLQIQLAYLPTVNTTKLHATCMRKLALLHPFCSLHLYTPDRSLTTLSMYLTCTSLEGMHTCSTLNIWYSQSSAKQCRELHCWSVDSSIFVTKQFCTMGTAGRMHTLVLCRTPLFQIRPLF